MGPPLDDAEEDRSFMRSGTGENNFRLGRWKSFYALLVNSDNKIVGTEPPPELGTSYPLNNTVEGYRRIYPINSQGEERVWRSSYLTGKARVENNEIFLTERGSVKQKIFHEDKREVLFSNWTGTEFNAGTQGTNVLDQLGLSGKFDYPKSVKTLELTFWMQSFGKSNYTMIDYFGGSGTSAHAVINNNRQDLENRTRKYILVEQGEYFDTVIKPRIQKVVYSADWRDGKPTNPESGISHCLKVMKLESYEDTLNNLELVRKGAQQTLLAEQQNSTKPEDQNAYSDYLMHYMLELESKDSLLNVKDFLKPFSYQMNITTDSAGAFERKNIDLVETFNYLIGLNVQIVDYQLERGYVTVEGLLRTGEKTLILWRDCEKIGYKDLDDLLQKRLKVNPKDKEYKLIYINGDHNIPSPFIKIDGEEKQLKVRSIEQTFLKNMFEE